MSYILDALRRAEAERDGGALPGLNTQAVLHVTTDRGRLGRGNPWLWLLAGMVAAVLLGTLVRLGWRWAATGLDAGPAMAPATAAATAAAAPVEPAPPLALPASPMPLPSPVPLPLLSLRPASAVSSPSAAASGAPLAQPAALPAARTHAPAEPTAEVDPALPNLVFGGLIQLEDPPRRSLIINGAIFMEGDTVQPDLVLEQIRLNAAVLRYKGQRYEVPI